MNPRLSFAASAQTWTTRLPRGSSSFLQPELARALDLPGYVRGAYETAVAAIERLDGESDFDATMRRISHLHLTRFVRNLLGRGAGWR